MKIKKSNSEYLVFAENNYPYLIFDGLNSHIPYEYNGKWVLPNADTGDTSEELRINVADTDGEEDTAIISEKLIRYIKSIKKHQGYLLTQEIFKKTAYSLL